MRAAWVMESFINQAFVVLSSQNDTMSPYNAFGYEENGYSDPSRGERRPLGYGDPLYPSTIKRYRDGMLSDPPSIEAYLEPMPPMPSPPNDSVAGLVFGGMMNRQRLSLEHLAALLRERERLHERHAFNLRHRNYEVQGRLFGAKLHGRLDDYKRATRLEQLLVQIEDQQRREELDFWKDTMELQRTMVEAAQEYDALRQRASLLDDDGPAEEESRD
jgi:hypothetical protein